MRKLLWFTVLLMMTLFPAVSSFGQEDEEKPATHEEQLKGHPSVPGFPGFALTAEEHHDFGAHEFPTGVDEEKRVEGKTWDLHYDAQEGARQPSALEIVRNYKNAFEKKGGSVVFAREDGGSATFKLPTATGELWVDLDARDNGWFILDIVETAAMQQKVELSATEMAEALKASGHLALHGILFDTGKADIKAVSQPVLDEITKLLKQDNSLKLGIEGHTDNVGMAPANLELSRKRAEAVKAALTKSGIDQSRLSAEGFGSNKPVADNPTAVGRAKNRRVELVKK